MNDLKKLIREVPDYPKPGILFYDLTTLLKDKQGFHTLIDRLCDHCNARRAGRLAYENPACLSAAWSGRKREYPASGSPALRGSASSNRSFERLLVVRFKFGGAIQALGLMKNPPSYCGSGVAGSSCTVVTLEHRGPRSSIVRNSACCCGVAMAHTSTRPSRRFLTKPVACISSAASCVK